MIELALALIGAIVVSLIGLYFVRKNFRTARETGVIYIRGSKYNRVDSEAWFRVAYVLNWITGGFFLALGVSAVVLAILIIAGTI